MTCNRGRRKGRSPWRGGARCQREQGRDRAARQARHRDHRRCIIGRHPRRLEERGKSRRREEKHPEEGTARNEIRASPIERAVKLRMRRWGSAAVPAARQKTSAKRFARRAREHVELERGPPHRAAGDPSRRACPSATARRASPRATPQAAQHIAPSATGSKSACRRGRCRGGASPRRRQCPTAIGRRKAAAPMKPRATRTVARAGNEQRITAARQAAAPSPPNRSARKSGIV